MLTDFEKYQKMPTKLLHPAEWNYKQDDEGDKLTKLTNNFKKNGQVENILVREITEGDFIGEFEVINGNHRLIVIQELDIPFVLVYNFGQITLAEAQRVAVETNETKFPADFQKLAGVFENLKREFGIDDMLETMPFTRDDFDGMAELLLPDKESAPGEGDEDEIPEEVVTRCKIGDVWQLGEHRLVCGDATVKEDVEKLMQGEKADLLITDPPYGIDYDDTKRQAPDGHSRGKFGKIKGDLSVPDYEKMVGHILRDGGVFYIYAGTKVLVKSIPILEEHSHISMVLIWMKNNFTISRMDYKAQTEFVIYGWKKGTHSWYGENNESNVIKEHWVGKERVHPTQKPTGQLELFINNSSKQTDLVLDLFGGSGSTLIACETSNRRCFMMEIDPHYCDVIIQRWEDYTGEVATIVGGDDGS